MDPIGMYAWYENRYAQTFQQIRTAITTTMGPHEFSHLLTTVAFDSYPDPASLSYDLLHKLILTILLYHQLHRQPDPQAALVNLFVHWY
jgi:hypothetical protein